MPIRETIREEDIGNVGNVIPTYCIEKIKKNLVSTLLSIGYKKVHTYCYGPLNNNNNGKTKLQAYDLWEDMGEMCFRREDLLIDEETVSKENRIPILKVAIRYADNKNSHLDSLVKEIYFKVCGNTPKEQTGRTPQPGTKVYAFARRN
jgi:hypothetical protein